MRAGAAMTKMAEAMKPLHDSLTDEQKQRLRMLMRPGNGMMAMGGGAGPRGMHRHQQHGHRQHWHGGGQHRGPGMGGGPRGEYQQRWQHHHGWQGRGQTTDARPWSGLASGHDGAGRARMGSQSRTRLGSRWPGHYNGVKAVTGVRMRRTMALVHASHTATGSGCNQSSQTHINKGRPLGPPFFIDRVIELFAGFGLTAGLLRRLLRIALGLLLCLKVLASLLIDNPSTDAPCRGRRSRAALPSPCRFLHDVGRLVHALR